MLTQLQDTVCRRPSRFGYLRPSHVRRHCAPQPLRHGQGGLGRSPARGPVPGAGRGHGGGEDRAPGARARRSDARTRDAGDRRAGGRRDVGPRPCKAGYGPRQAAGHASITRTWPGWAIACADGLVPRAGQHRQPRVLRVGRVGRAPQAHRERPSRGCPGSPSGAGRGAPRRGTRVTALDGRARGMPARSGPAGTWPTDSLARVRAAMLLRVGRASSSSLGPGVLRRDRGDERHVEPGPRRSPGR